MVGSGDSIAEGFGLIWMRMGRGVYGSLVISLLIEKVGRRGRHRNQTVFLRRVYVSLATSAQSGLWAIEPQAKTPIRRKHKPGSVRPVVQCGSICDVGLPVQNLSGVTMQPRRSKEDAKLTWWLSLLFSESSCSRA